jgi:hypothetical protein
MRFAPDDRAGGEVMVMPSDRGRGGWRRASASAIPAAVA